MTLFNDETREYYEELTEVYLQYGQGAFAWHIGLAEDPETTHEESLFRANELITEGLGLNSQSRVIDCGCGVGGLAFYIAAKFGSRVLGLTLSGEHVELATKEARRRGLEDLVEFRVHDFMEPLEDAFACDAVLSQDAFCHAPDAAGFLKNVLRMLRPGGVWRAVDAFYTDRNGPGAEDPWGPSIRDGWKVDSLFAIRKVQEVAAEAGFRRISFLDVSTQAYSSARGFLTAQMGLDLLDQLGGKRPDRWADQGEAFNLHMAANAAWGAGLLSGDISYGMIEGRSPASI